MDIPFDRFDLTVGFFILCGLIVIVALTVFMAAPTLFEIGSVELKTYLPSTYGLRKGVPVTYLEIEVGHVKAVTLSGRESKEEQVEVLFTVDEDHRKLITTAFHTSLEQNDVMGLISGGEIILHPPEDDQPTAGRPVEAGDVLRYKKTPAMLEGLTDLPQKLEEEVLPKIDRLLTEFNDFMAMLNDPGGDVRMTISSLRKLSELLTDPDGDFLRALGQFESIAEELADDENNLMSLLRDRKLNDSIEEIAANAVTITRDGTAITKDARDLLEEVSAMAAPARPFLDENLPRITRFIENLLKLQQAVAPLIANAERISRSLVESTENLPGMMSDVETQLREVEDITRSLKQFALIRWNLEEEVIEDPTLIKPILLHGFQRNSEMQRSD